MTVITGTASAGAHRDQRGAVDGRDADGDRSGQFQCVRGADQDVAGANGPGKVQHQHGRGVDPRWTMAHNEVRGGPGPATRSRWRRVDGTQQVLTVTMHGTDDATVITGTASAELTETNAAQSTGGTLTATDPDSSNAFVAQDQRGGANSITGRGVEDGQHQHGPGRLITVATRWHLMDDAAPTTMVIVAARRRYSD